MKQIKEAGDIIEAHCTRCRTAMNHTIVALVGELVVKVECNTCHSIHKYHSKKELKTSAPVRAAKVPATPSRREKKGAAPDPAEEWTTLMAAMDPARAVPYDMNRSCRTGEMISHPLFGLGIVRKLAPPHKMEVLFRTGSKLLRCG